MLGVLCVLCAGQRVSKEDPSTQSYVESLGDSLSPKFKIYAIIKLLVTKKNMGKLAFIASCRSA